MRCIGYVRVSLTKQATEGVSIPTQVQAIESFCQARRWKLQTIIRDEGASGKDLNRPGMRKLLKAIERRRADVVVTYKLDRLGRSLYDILTILEYLKKAGMQFACVMESYDTTNAMGELFLQISAAFAEVQRKLIGERTRAGMQYLKKQGRFFGRPPFGYRVVGKLLVPDEAAIKHVRMILRWHREGLSLRAIARQLNASGAGDRHWYAASVRYVLRNPLYKR